METEGEEGGSYENFGIYVDEMINITKEPFYKGFLYMLKAMARMMIEGREEEIDSMGLREIKMAKLYDPRAAQHLFVK